MEQRDDIFKTLEKGDENSKRILKSIKQYCRDECSAGDIYSWRNCTDKKCKIWKYRLGKMPVLASKTSNPTQTLQKQKSSKFSREKRGVTGTGGQI